MKAESCPPNDGRRASVDGACDGDDDNHIRVICRVRPSFGAAASRPACVSVGEDGKTVVLKAGGGPKQFTFDHAAGPGITQEEMFQMAGKPATRSCLQGYNGTIFCYGQTGSGKTFTMFGPNQDDCNSEDEKRGLVPRVLEYLFSHIAREERRNGGLVKHLCRCSFYEIFNEKVFDLLDAGCSIGGLQVREDMKKGVYVEGLTEEAVEAPHQAYQILAKGYRNRHVGETAMNRESSRSHAVFTLVVESREVNPVDGITRSRCSSFHLVDLAGSERQSATGATGERLKEAGSINKSLSALGNVINALVEAANGKSRYIPYRDSRLSFLLRDSLGGNAKTFLVAALSATEENFAETLSTLKFAQRAKMIKNKAVVNEDTSGTVEALQKELRMLRQELLSARAVISASGSGVSGPSHEAAGSVEGEVLPASAPSTTTCHGTQDAATRRLESLLKDALERSVRLEKARELAEQKVRNSQQVVDRVEQALLSEKMVRKLKENVIQRMKPKTGKAAASASSSGSEEGGSPTASEEVEELRQEVELLRKEVEMGPKESVRWRLAFEDAQAQLTALADKNGLGMWVESSEQSFTRSLEEELQAVLADKADLQATVAKLQEDLASRPAVRRLSDGGLQRLRDAEGRVAEMEEKLVVSRRVAQDAESRLAQTQAELARTLQAQSQLTMTVTALERKLGAINEENQTLKQERDAEMAALQERITHLQAQEQDQHDLQGQLAAACRDNCVLLQRLRDTAAEADETLARKNAALADAKAAEEALAKAEEQVAGLQASLSEAQQSMEEQAANHQQQAEALREQLEAALKDARSAALAHEQELSALQSHLDEADARAQSLREEKEQLSFQLANLQEDHETQGELLEFTSSKKAEVEAELAKAQAHAQELQARCSRQDEAIQGLHDRVSSLESELDRVGGDYANERRQLRDAEQSLRDALEERASLSSELEQVRSELEASREEWALADKAAKEQDKRQAQVIADLSEQVSRLREEVRAAEERAQAAEDGATGLEQERDCLRQRVAEAEEARAAMADENGLYLEEIEALKAKVVEREQAAEEELRALQAQSSALLQKAKDEAAALNGEVGVLRWESDSLKEALEKAKAEKETYLQMVEEARGAHQDASQASQVLMAKYQQLEAELAALQDEAKELRRRNKEAEKEVQEAQWRHAEDESSLKSALADAQARAAEAASARTALGAAQAKVSSLTEAVTGLEREMETLRAQKAAADERCQALANKVGESMSLQKDQQVWERERARLDDEVARARAMENEAYERYEVVEHQRQKVAKEVETLEKEVEELKAANVRLIGHANSRQKIQLHRKLKEELTTITARAKQLEDENYRLRLQAASSKKGLADHHGSSRADTAAPLQNVTNIMTRSAAAAAAAAGGAENK